MIGVRLSPRVFVVLVDRRTRALGFEEVERSRTKLIVDLHADDLVKLRPRRHSYLVALEMIDSRIGQRRRRGGRKALRAGHHQAHCPDHVELDRSELVHDLLLLQLRLGALHHLVPGEMVRIHRCGSVLIVDIGRSTELIGSSEGNRRCSELIHQAHARNRGERERFDRVALEMIRDSVGARGESGDLARTRSEQRQGQQSLEKRNETGVAATRRKRRTVAGSQHGWRWRSSN